MTAAFATCPPASAAVHVRAGEAGVHAIGEFDIATVFVLEDALDRAVELGGDVLLDLSYVTFLDAAALSVIVRAARELLHTARTIRIVHPTPAIAKLFRIAELDALTS